MGKILEVRNLYKETLNDITKSVDDWKAFLNSASWNFKYSFDDQVLIYAQRPDATACAEMTEWNQKVKRWVNKNAKVIFVKAKDSSEYPYRMVFDVSDTHNYQNTPYKLWQIKKEFEKDIIETLENSFGEIDDKDNLAQAIILSSYNMVMDNMQDYLMSISKYKENSKLENMSNDEIQAIFMSTLWASVSYMMLKRVGFDADKEINNSEFSLISNFNNENLISIIGTATSDIAEMGLREIAKTVIYLKKEERKYNRTLESKKEMDYSNIEKEIEGGENNVKYRIQETRRLYDTKYNVRGGENSNRKVRTNEIEFLKNTEKSRIPNIVERQEVSRTFNADTRTSNNNDKSNYSEISGERWIDRENETGKTNEMDRLNEQLQDDSGRTSNKGIDLHLELLTEKEQMEKIADTDNSVPAIFEFTQEMIDMTLQNGSGFEDGKFRIYKQITSSLSSKDNVEFLKQEYGIGGSSSAYIGANFGQDHNSKGIKLYKGFNENRPEKLLTWNYVEKRIKELILADRYFSSKEFEEYQKWLDKDINENIENINDLEKPVEKILEYHLGDIVYLGSNEFEITNIGTFDIQLNDVKFPLLSREISKDEFEERVKENPANSHLLKIKEEANNNQEIQKIFDNVIKEIVKEPKHIEKNYEISEERYFHFHTNEEGYYYAIYDKNGVEQDGGLLEYSNDENNNSLMDIRKRLAEFTNLAELTNENLKEVSQEFIENLELNNESNEFVEQEIITPINELDELNSYTVSRVISKDKCVELHYDNGQPYIEIGRKIDNETWENETIDADWFSKELNDNEMFDKLGNIYDKEFKEEKLKDFFEKIFNKYEIDDYRISENEKIEIVINDLHLSIIGTFKYLLNRLEDYNEQFIGNDRKKILEELSKARVIQREKLINKRLKYEEAIYTVIDISEKEDEEDFAIIQNNDTKEVNTDVIGYIETLVEEQQAMEKKDLYNPNERKNYKIADNELGVGTPKEKFKKNIEAIKLLRNLENENKLATKEEQEVLSQYTGWGGLAKAFDENDSSWSNEYNILKDLLSEEEYKNARASTLTAFYTPPVVIKSIYKTLENLGVKNANILEPSCGVGNFLGLIPETMNQSKMYGIELDSLSGRIAKQLYQKSNIAISGYEKVDLPDSFFDIAVGNVPFGDFKVVDKRYDKNNFLIHDYFFAKTLDKVRPGGIVAFITSKGTLDKENPSVRKYIAQRAELLGAIRLPNNTFSKNAGTEVTSDIIFLQKRENMTDIVPDWVYLDKDENGIVMNKYFVDNPQMILGNMEMKTTQYGLDSTCTPDNNTSLEEQLNYAISNINGEITEFEIEDIDDDDKSIMADPSVKNFSYTIVNDEVYYRENSKMYLQDLPVTTVARIKGMIELRECTRKLIEMQTEDYPEENIKNEQIKLNKLYDNFTKKYGLINSRGNSQAFSDDSSYFLLCSLEIMDSDGKFLKKADMFSKRTIKPYKEIKNVSTSNEALIVSMSEKAKVDLDYMSQLTNKDKETIIKELEGYIYEDPIKRGIFYTADEYLSGNIREKLEIAKGMALTHSEFQKNVDSLERVMPEEIGASEIGIKLGSTWIPEDIIQDFIFELLDTPSYITWGMKVRYSKYNSEWYVENKNRDRGNVKANRTYGTDRINAYKIIETTLNLKDVKIFDNIVDENGNKTRVLNKKETAIAQAKQEQIKKEFEDWVWKNPERRNKLVKIYNEKFNSIRPREYDGSNLIFAGMNPEIQLRKHQVNAIAHVLYGGNTLLAHEVGAGKTFEMVASAMESKRLGLCNKSLFVVPNHIIEQFAAEFLQLYPSANILVATKKDFQTANRKKFCSRIATGEYDAVIIGHSQFEKIPMSIERQKAMLEKQINDILKGIDEVKRNKGENFTIKQLEKSRKGLEAKLEKLNNQTNKDDVITFEQLGVDKLFVDEAHNYKNLFLYTKMRNVGGIAQTEAQKSTDLYMKCRYLDEITNGKGVVFATGTPVSNSMVELYTMQRYLQYNTLEKMQLEFFDSWASTFGETVTAIELSPEGTGYRTKTRFAKFHNLPELMSMFKEIADIQTADTLNLPTPNVINKNIVTKPSQLQKEMVEELGNRAEKIRNGMVDASQDNMLKITNEGRKLALDQRLMNDMLEDDPSSKVNECCQNIYNIWNDTKEKKSTQLVFCDLSTPKQFEESVGENGSYKFTDVYNDLRRKLELKGIPKEEIAFIHEADNEVKKKELFGKVRNGEVRVLIGSTSKMGAGTNVQNKLIALHHLDCPWRPADLTQRNGRGVRQGNENENIEIYTYVTEQTFDAYLYQLVENKQKFISQIMTSKTPVRVAEDIDEKALSYGEIKALATGNPYILEKTELDSAVAKIKLLKQSFLSQKYDLQDRIVKYYPNELKRLEEKITAIENDVKYLTEKTYPNTDGFSPMTINGITYTEKGDAGQAIIDVCQKKNNPELETIGEYRGFKMELEYSRFEKEFVIKLTNEYSYSVNLGNDVYGNIQRLDNCLEKMPEKIKLTKEQLENEKVQFENAKMEVEKEFPQEKELQEKQKRLDELNIKLNLNEKDSEILDDGEVEKEEIDVNNKNQYCNKEPVR